MHFQEVQSPIQYTSKLIKIKQKERLFIKSSKGKATYKGNPIQLTIFQEETCRPEENGRIYLKYCTGKIYNQG